eukprot:1159496-Pelagomonas_calceolata.AAC.5
MRSKPDFKRLPCFRLVKGNYDDAEMNQARRGGLSDWYVNPGADTHHAQVDLVGVGILQEGLCRGTLMKVMGLPGFVGAHIACTPVGRDLY